MKCLKCGKEIYDDSNLCEECKNINEDTKDFDDTKEIVNIDSIINDSSSNTDDLFNENETRESRYLKKKRFNIIILILSIFFVSIIVVLVLLFLNSKDNSQDTYEIDYEKILNMYGRKIEKYLLKNVDVEKLSDVDIEFDYKVECEIEEINFDKTIYLDICKIDDESIKHSYGERKDDNLTTLTIYKSDNKYNDSNGDIVGTIDCLSKDCKYYEAFDKYVIVKEKDNYNLYDYEKNKKIYGPFSENFEVLNTGNSLYGIYVKENSIGTVYSLNNNKEFKNINGSLTLQDIRFNPTVMYKYGYVMFDNDGYDFVNLKNGKVNYSIKDSILKIEEDFENNIAYILTYTLSTNNFKIINTHGKELFNGKTFSYFKLSNDEIIVADAKNFKIYDSKLNLKNSSKLYESLFVIDDNYLVAFDSKELKLIDFQDNLLASFKLSELDKSTTIDHAEWGTKDGKNVIIIYLKDTNIKLYYNPSTGEIEKE